MPNTSSEYFEAQRAARDFLRHVCGYEYLHHDEEAFRRERGHQGETLLLARLEKQLHRLNPNLTESAVRRASQQLYQPEAAALVFAQKQAHDLLLPSSAAARVRYFDFEQPEKNNFLLVESYRWAGASTAIACDFVIFVNGIPLALVAVGNQNSKEGLLHAANRLVQLQAAAPRLFHTAQILVCVQKNFSGVGTVGMRAEAFAPWEEPHPLTWEELRAAIRQIPQRESELPTAQDLALAGMLSPHMLLNLFKNFLVHEYGEHGLVSRLAWSHQYHAVRQVCAQLAAPRIAPRMGVIWHPGRSGKTYTLAWLVAQLRCMPAYAQHQIFIVTDCEKQRRLVRETLTQQRLLSPYEAKEVVALLNLMRRARAETVLLPHACLHELLQQPGNEAASQLFLFDERAGDDMLSATQQVFPRAQIILCSAYPLRRGAARSALLHFFSYAQAQRRGYLLSARLEVRLPRLHQNLSATLPAAFNKLSVELQAQRIASIAEDLHEHFMQELRGNHGKAIVLVESAQAAAWYFNALKKNLPEQVAVLLPKPAAHERELLLLYRRFGEIENLLPHWQDPNDNLVLLILAVPVHEDLRAPHVHAVYVDRELRGDELLRALALAQTPAASTKQFGLLVDYYGVAQDLEAELAQFDFQQTEPVLAPRYAESDFEELRLWRRELRALVSLYPEEENFEAWLMALEPAEQRRAFSRTWLGYLKALEQVLPRAQTEHGLMQEALWFDRMRQEAARFYFDHGLSQAQGTPKVRQMLESATRTYGVMRVRETARITSENFMQEIDALGTVQARVLRLQYALGEEIRQNLARDPGFYQALQQRVAKITAERQQKKISDEEALQRLREEALRLRTSALTLGKTTQLAEEAQAYWRVLVRYLAPAESEHKRYEDLATRLLATLEPDTRLVDWTLKEDWQREMRRKIKHLLREVNCPEDLLDPLTHAVMQLTRARFGS